MSRTHFTLRQSLRVVLAMGWADFVLKYRGSFLGYLWSLIGPITKFLVIYYVFSPFISPLIPRYPLYLFLGIIIWEHFTLTTTSCMTMLFEKETIIQKLAFPRILLIFMAGWTNLIIFLTHLIIYAFFAWFFGVSWQWGMLYGILILLQMTLIALGIGMLLSAYCLKYRDIPHLWTVMTQILFWLTPVTYVYRLDKPLFQSAQTFVSHLSQPTLTSVFDLFVHIQPLSILIYDARRALLYVQTSGVPSLLHAAVFTFLCILLFGIGALVFQHRSRYFLQEY